MRVVRDFFAIATAALFLVTIISPSKCDEGCVFNVIDGQAEKNLPVPLYNSSSEYELAIPDHGAIYLSPGQNLSLLCSGTRNYVRQTNSNVTTVTCLKGDQVRLYRKTYKFHEIQCKNIVRGEVRRTEKKCGNDRGLIYEIGYTITRKDWITLITVCYQPESGATLYTRHVIHGKQIAYASKNAYRPGFSNAGQLPHISASLIYKQAYQKGRFSQLLGSSLLASSYINDKSYLARGHLAPHADFLLATAQFSSYYYINAVPQWQSVNAGNWKSIEIAVRKMATYYGDLDVFTGTHETLTYPDKEGRSQTIHLKSNGILPVPRYFWKLVFEPRSRRGLVFVIVNDPFAKSAQEAVFCTDVCAAAGFTKTNWKDSTKGVVFCCDVSEFQNVVDTVPQLGAIQGRLSEPIEDLSIQMYDELRLVQ